MIQATTVDKKVIAQRLTKICRGWYCDIHPEALEALDTLIQELEGKQ